VRRQILGVWLGLAVVVALMIAWRGWQAMVLPLGGAVVVALIAISLIRRDLRRAGCWRSHADPEELTPVAMEFSWRRALVMLLVFVGWFKTIPAVVRLERTLPAWGEDLTRSTSVALILVVLILSFRFRPARSQPTR